ncbi:MAG: acetyl-CoA carboxylase biotin carboxylase subunit, partial [Gammaproteobacteria bacterium]
DFRPSPGTLTKFSFDLEAGPGKLRLDTHLKQGETVPPHYDSLLGKLIAWGETRDEAIATLLAGLQSAQVEGLPTTISLHESVLQSDAFRSGDYDTASIPGWPPVAASN